MRRLIAGRGDRNSLAANNGPAMDSVAVTSQHAKRLAVCLTLFSIGCSTTSNDVGTLPMLYRPLERISPCEITQYTPANLLDRIGEGLKDHPDDSMLLQDRAWLRAKSGEYEGAIEDFHAALAAEPGQDPGRRAQMLCRMGITYYSMSMLSEAIDAYSIAIEYDPDNWELYFHRWLALKYAGHTEEAAADRRKGQALKPDVFNLNYSSEGGII